jgi:hypothetical protein
MTTMNRVYKHPENAEEQIALCENCANELDAEPCDDCGVWTTKDCEKCGAKSLPQEMFLPDGNLDMSKQIPHADDIVKR